MLHDLHFTGRIVLASSMVVYGEGAYERYACPMGVGEDCGCATTAGCTIPPEHFYVVLPYRGDPIERDLEFGTTIRVADIFFITDTTGSMSGISSIDGVLRSRNH